MPPLIYQLMDLYPQAGVGRPSVTYVPYRRAAPERAQPPAPASPGH